MQNLKKYVEDQNFWRKLSKQELMTFPLSSSDASDIVYSLKGDLSPENLHCDGEISNEEAQRKYVYLRRVHTELELHVGHPLDLCY